MRLLKINGLLILVLFLRQGIFAQTGFTYSTKEVKTSGILFDFSAGLPDYKPQLILVKSTMPQPISDVQQTKLALDKMRAEKLRNKSNAASPQKLHKAVPPSPQLLRGFFGNVAQGTPNDNDIAISNSGKFIMSACNTNYNMYNDSGKFLAGRTLAGIAAQLGPLNSTFDPRVIYDPEKDRFIAVFLQGSTHEDTRIIVGFTQSEDPTKVWKFYELPGNLWGDSSWSDYPIIAITKEELFITVNRVKDKTPWQTGFIESLIWQVKLSDGYAGDSLTQKVYGDIKYNNKTIWSICPAKGGAGSYGPNQYFVSLRPSDLSNDTVFLHEITNTIASGSATLTLKILKADNKYGLQPNAIQPSGQYLQTNDARALSAMFEDDKIQFVGNCMYTPEFSPGIYHGVIDYVSSNPVVKAKNLGYDSMDIGYPSIAFAGTKGDNNSAMITFSYVSPTRYAGTAAIFVDRNLDYSFPVLVKAGESNINVLADTIERWGDYTGIQRKYNETGMFCLNGSYAINGGHNTWIAKIRNMDPRLGVKQEEGNITNTTVYPNPVSELVSIEFAIQKTDWLDFYLYDVQGKMVTKLLRDKAKAGLNKFTISTSDLPNGIYYINIQQHEQILENKKIVVAH